MSAASIPFINRTGFFPGARPRTVPGLTADFINLTAYDGDGGLREAMRLWWCLEQVEFTPSGTVTFTPSSRSFSKVFRAPDSFDVAGSNGSITGSMVASTSLTGLTLATTTKEPALRTVSSEIGLFYDLLNYHQTWLYVPSPNTELEAGSAIFRIQNVSGQWRLYYEFSFQITTTRTTPSLAQGSLFITNPSNSQPPIATGTMTVAGYSLSWSAFTTPSGATASGVGLSATSVEWTF